MNRAESLASDQQSFADRIENGKLVYKGSIPDPFELKRDNPVYYKVAGYLGRISSELEISVTLVPVSAVNDKETEMGIYIPADKAAAFDALVQRDTKTEEAIEDAEAAAAAKAAVAAEDDAVLEGFGAEDADLLRDLLSGI